MLEYRNVHDVKTDTACGKEPYMLLLCGDGRIVALPKSRVDRGFYETFRGGIVKVEQDAVERTFDFRGDKMRVAGVVMHRDKRIYPVCKK